MQVGAVVEAAVFDPWLQVGHQSGQVHGVDMVQPKLLKSRRINQGRALRAIDPVQIRACGGVLARVQSGGDFAGQHLRPRHQQVDERALARARRPQHQRCFPLECLDEQTRRRIAGD